MSSDSTVCPACGAPLSKIGTMKSGNATYVRYRCSGCHQEKSVCLGIDK